ncbi:tyrosine-type recombinase/integrase [Ferrovibrio sp.]|uniref:tyrosine-type recombinase/integrase n=1 Tax=Ferrovibrio sp. TaxID=1917215 RepID=UPI000CC39376|nr:tyrosine-type recombinase/integrase [Ferrovibrio sp.]PJI40389.1 MAG: hypothetical protein CTR53_10285 [Ferrovibrio sp.]
MENNKITLRDGNLVLHKRGGVWHYRLRIPGMTGYERRSTNEKQQGDAERKALNRYDELRYEYVQGRNALPLTFMQVATRYLAAQEKIAELGGIKDSKFKTHRTAIHNALIPHFGQKLINKITEADIAQFAIWRENGGRVDPGERAKQLGYYSHATRALKRHGKVSVNTVKNELSVLSGVFQWAINNNLMNRKERPEISYSKKSYERRPAYDQDTLQKLRQGSYKWVEEARPQMHYARMRIRIMTDVAAYTGMRPGEIKNMKWGWIILKGNQYEFLTDGKTGRRPVQPLEEAVTAIMEWREYWRQYYGRDPNPDEYVFANTKAFSNIKSDTAGSKFMNHEGIFLQMALACDCRFDPYGDTFTMYSLRHFFITYALERGVDVYLIERNTGTSVEMIRKHYDHASLMARRAELMQGHETFDDKWKKVVEYVAKTPAQPVPDTQIIEFPKQQRG